jgi:hypothetical protein
VAHADAAGPTDYRTEIVSVEPSTPTIELSIEGGDSFIAIDVQPGTQVLILGYADEPYVLIEADGTVRENLRSQATYYNQDRYGTADIPDTVDNEAAPEWHDVGSGGSWAWHDHRAHWMGAEPLLGFDPGDSLPPEQISLLVDGSPVTVTVVTTLVAPPSAVVPVFGAVIGMLLALLGTMLGPATTTLLLALTSAGAVTVGAGQYLALPASTGPLVVWWLLPTMALIAAITAIATYGRSRWVHLGLNALAGLQLAVWAWQRRLTLTRPVLPTTLPPGFDRFVTSGALVAGALVVVFTVRSMFTVPTVPAELVPAESESVSPEPD